MGEGPSKRTDALRLTLLQGYEYCDVHGAIHEHSNDPYGEGRTTCQTRDRRTVYVYARPSEGLGPTA